MKIDDIEIPQELKFYKLSCTRSDTMFNERGVIATELDYETIFSRLNNSELIDKFDLEQLETENVKFPVTLIGVEQKYSSWEDLVKDYFIAKISGVIR